MLTPLSCTHATRLGRVVRQLAPSLARSASAYANGDLLAALDNNTHPDKRFIPGSHVHVVSHCTLPEDKADEFWSLAQELVPHCRKEPHQVYQHLLRARPMFGRNPATEFVWLEEWTKVRRREDVWRRPVHNSSPVLCPLLPAGRFRVPLLGEFACLPLHISTGDRTAYRFGTGHAAQHSLPQHCR